MEIRSNTYQAYLTSRAASARSEKDVSDKQQLPGNGSQQDEAQKANRTAPSGTSHQDNQAGYPQQHGLSAQILQKPNTAQSNEPYRIGQEPHRVQQALTAYEDNASLREEDGELMPRLDGYV